MASPIDLTDDGNDDVVHVVDRSVMDDMDDDGLDVAIARCREDLEDAEAAVSYTHLTLPTIYSV